VLRGDIAYASPERMRLERVDARSDLFSLGLVLLELLTGRHLFDLEDVEQAALVAGPAPAVRTEAWCEEPSWVSVSEMAARIARFGPEDVERTTQGVSEPLRAVVHRALRREPAERYQSGLELREAELLRESADVIEPDVFVEVPPRRTEH
jgi:serine/threonine-protein kinase